MKCQFPLDKCDREATTFFKQWAKPGEERTDYFLCQEHGEWSEHGTRQLGGECMLFVPFSVARDLQRQLGELQEQVRLLRDGSVDSGSFHAGLLDAH